MNKFRITLKPLSPFFFGGEKGFNTSEEQFKKNERNKSYFIKSRNMPQQTSLLGMLRFEVLKQSTNFRIKNYWEYTHDDFEKMYQLIGKNSFDISKDEQNFGVIEEIGPIKIAKSIGQPLDVLPLDHNNVDDKFTQYTPFELVEKEGLSNYGSLYFLNGYDAKEGLMEAWMDKDKKIISNQIIFESIDQVGIRTSNQSSGNDDKGFYKQQFKHLKNDYVFTFNVKFKDNFKLNSSTVELGKERSSFMMIVQSCDDEMMNYNDDGKIVFENDAFLTMNQLKTLNKYLKFRIVKEKAFRNLKRQDREQRFSDTKHHFIQRGSVFFTKSLQDKKLVKDLIQSNKNLVNIGYNQIR